MSIDNIFPNDLKSRNEYILNEIKNNNYTHYWIPVAINYNDNEIIIYISGDALKINNIRINVSASMNQKIADMLDASLLTSKIADLVYQSAAIKIRPFTQMINYTTQGMILHSSTIDNYIEDFCKNPDIRFDPQYNIVSNVGKYWILDNMVSLTKAVNYGWFVNDFPLWKGIKTYPTKVKGLYTLQPIANAHESSHVDYSQTCSLLKNECLLNGNTTTIQTILSDDNLYQALSYIKLNTLRQP